MYAKNCLSYWFPKIHAAGLPVPETEIVILPQEAQRAIFGVFDGKPIGDATQPFLEELRSAVLRRGTPCFLRTGQGSGKHNWKNCCFVADIERLPWHVAALAEWSEMVDFLGLPWDVWCVRELLPTQPEMIATNYGDMPVNREFRFFVRDAEVVCFHPYWPRRALIEGIGKDVYDRTAHRHDWRLPEGFDLESTFQRLSILDEPALYQLRDLASRAGAAVGGEWSVDLLETTCGWYVTDMAIAANSYHWEDCPQQPH